MPRNSSVRLAAALAACALVPAVLAGFNHPPGLVAHMGFGAEVAIHLLTYFVLTVLVYVATLSMRHAARWSLVLAVVDEIVQRFVATGCQPSIAEWFVDLTGIVVACMMITRHRMPGQRRMTWQA